VTVDANFWSSLVDLNKAADALIARAKARIEPSQPVSREITTHASIEVRFDNLPVTYTVAPPGVAPTPNSDALWGNNVKRGIWTNGASRLYLRELAFERYFVDSDNKRLVAPGSGIIGVGSALNTLPPYYRWNFQTSITQKQYADKRVSMFAGGRPEAGNHLAFRDPLVIEPMETFTFEVELLSYGAEGSPLFIGQLPSYVVALHLAGYREGM